MKKLALSVVLVMAVLATAGWSRDAAASESFTVVQLTNTDAFECYPQVSGDRVVWQGYHGSDYDIFACTPSDGIRQLTADIFTDSNPQVSGDRVVWVKGFLGDGEIYTWTPAGGTMRVSAEDVLAQNPQVSGDRIVWSQGGYGGGDIFTWTPGGGTRQLTDTAAFDEDPQISGDRIVWQSLANSEWDVYLWTPASGVVNLTADRADNATGAQVSGDRVAWVEGGFLQGDIFTWTPSGGTVRLTNNNYVDENLAVSGDRVVWLGSGSYGIAGTDIYTWTPSSGVVRLQAEFYPLCQPEVSGDRIVWYDSLSNHYSVYAWTPTSGIVQLAAYGDATALDGRPQVSGDRVVWQGRDGYQWEIFTALLPKEEIVFSDIATSPYKTAIEAMARAGIIGGYGNGLFGPGDPVKRAQFAKMADLSLELEVTEGGTPVPFWDVEKPQDNLYPDDYVAAAAANGLILGYNDGSFRPYDDIARAQLLTIVVRMAQGFKPEALTTPSSGWEGILSGSDPTHGANTRTAEYSGLLSGINLSTFSLWQSATRGEVAQILWNLREK